MAVIIFLALLVCLIIIHELGHFIAARIFHIPVEEFGIGFPPRIFGVKKGETLFSINALPFGGFVKILGETESTDAKLSDDILKRSFHKKSLIVQATVIIAGIVCNFIVAWILLSVSYTIGLPTSASEHTFFGHVENIKTEIVYVLPGSPAEKSGIQAGDIVVEAQTASSKLSDITSQSVETFINNHADETVIIQILRKDKKESFLAKPTGNIIPGHKAIGIELDDTGILKLPFYSAFLQGGILLWQITLSTAQGLIHFFVTIVTGTANFSQVAGPIGIAGLGAQAVQTGFISTITLVAIISINLALINVLPIPGLDGGRLLFIVIETIQGRPLPEKILTRITIGGFALLLVLIVVVSYHDVIRLFHI